MPAPPSPSRRPIRFGLQIDPATCDLSTIAGEAEAAGFDVVSVADHIASGQLAPLPVLAHLAAHSTRITLGTLVLNNEMRNPVQLAWEAATIHRLSRGRFELGLGAGHTPHEFAATGIAFDHPSVRKSRLAEAADIIGALFRGETVTDNGKHHRINDARLTVDQPPPRILIGGNGTALLTHAGANADIVGLQGLGRTRADGHRHSVRFGIDHLEAQLDVIARAGVDRARRPELNALVQVVDLTDDRPNALRGLVRTVDGLTLDDAASSPYLAIGTVDEIARQIVEARNRWGISYFTVRTMELAPVIARVREAERPVGR